MGNIWDRETDLAAENDGVWLNWGEGIEFKIAHLGSTNKAFARATAEMIRARSDIDVSDDEGSQLDLELFVDTVLKGWKGVTDRQGNTLAFNRENAIDLLSQLPHEYQRLRMRASQQRTFRKEVVAQLVKNSKKSSGSDSKTEDSTNV